MTAHALRHIDPAPSKLAWPSYTPDVLFHVGTLNASHKGTTHNASSLEGNGLSVSTEPEAWRSIARLGDAPVWAMQKLEPGTNGPKLIDRYALNQQHWDEVSDWALSNGLLEQIQAAKVSYFDEELDDRVAMLVELTNTYTQQHATEDYEGSDVTFTTVLAATQKLNELAGFQVPIGNATDIALTAYVQDVLWPEINADGVWWDEELDPMNYSAPRGTIHQSALPSWSAIPISEYQEQQKELEAFGEYVYEQASIAAAEIVGPNSIEYESLSERLCEDEKFISDCRISYASQKQFAQSNRMA